MKRSLLSVFIAAGIIFCGCELSDDIRVYSPDGTSAEISAEETESPDADDGIHVSGEITDGEIADDGQPEAEETAADVPEKDYEEEIAGNDDTQEEAAETDAPDSAGAPVERRLYGTVQEYLDNMTIEEKIGQVILARFPEDPALQARKYCYGGFTLYAKDFENETPESISAKLAEIDGNDPVPMFFATDEEGGGIVRVSKYKAFADRELPSMQEMLASGGDVEAWADELSENLHKAGINLDLAPVADVAESEEDYIYYRTCGLGYEETAEVIGHIVSAMDERNIVSCMKHFPGYGPNVDTHTGIAADSRSAETFESRDLLPFIGGIGAGAPMIMVNHNIVEAYNADVPASLAPEVHEMLRGLGFDGIIITDDLGMDAITLYTDDPYTAAFLAGNDMLCVSSGAACYDSLYNAYLQGKITEERLDESIERIIRVKLDNGII